jgi:hypothetical protein
MEVKLHQSKLIEKKSIFKFSALMWIFTENLISVSFISIN